MDHNVVYLIIKVGDKLRGHNHSVRKMIPDIS